MKYRMSSSEINEKIMKVTSMGSDFYIPLTKLTRSLVYILLILEDLLIIKHGVVMIGSTNM